MEKPLSTIGNEKREGLVLFGVVREDWKTTEEFQGFHFFRVVMLWKVREIGHFPVIGKGKGVKNGIMTCSVK